MPFDGAFVVKGTGMMYADPGSGLLLLQLVTSGVAGLVFFFRRKLSGFLRYFKRDTNNTNDRV